jgi:hypothetical protein
MSRRRLRLRWKRGIVESRDEACLRVSVAPVSLVMERDIHRVTVRECAHCYRLAVAFTVERNRLQIAPSHDHQLSAAPLGAQHIT